MTETAHHRRTLVLGGTGKTGRRLVERVTRRDIPVRIGSRSAGLPFDWDRPSTGGRVFHVEVAYASVPDRVVAEPTGATAGVVETALAAGTRRLVLLSGRGEEKAQVCEKILMDSGADWTILRASFFNQNFSENNLLDPVLAGEVRLPAGDVGEPFSDIDDIADVAATVLTEPGREITYSRILREGFAAGLGAGGVPRDIIDFLVDLFGTVLDGRTVEVADGVERVLGRPARDFVEYTRITAATGVWNPTDQPNPASPR